MESSAVATIPKKGDKPSLLAVLKKFRGKHCEFNILERIGKNYADFEISFLEDDDGSKVPQHLKQPDCTIHYQFAGHYDGVAPRQRKRFGYVRYFGGLLARCRPNYISQRH